MKILVFFAAACFRKMSAYELCHSKMQVEKKTPNSAWHNSKFQSVFDSSCEEAAAGQAGLVSSPVTLSGSCRKSWTGNQRWSPYKLEKLILEGEEGIFLQGASHLDWTFCRCTLQRHSFQPLAQLVPLPLLLLLLLHLLLHLLLIERLCDWLLSRWSRWRSRSPDRATTATAPLRLPSRYGYQSTSWWGKCFQSENMKICSDPMYVSETIASYKSIIATHLTSEAKSLLRRSPWWFGDNTTSGIISFKMFVPPPSCLILNQLKSQIVRISNLHWKRL